ncbi:undecaprenyl phosphate N,N'-diacetylbacillosamine 1-phosphate transferase [Bacillus sp. SLBN-46]|uniref:sugar transferase n=1 Tax=Bacillus sp. SLBN-46 TaxID=3042283 RepID=UPI00285B3A5C|nr:undecaprenyl phosphate N,N'-diacetylbacillosamine 1-phosphate transferase [Bacillus sp. SLBN-46]
MYRKYFKRLLDFLMSLLALILLCPVLVITALLVRWKFGSPVLFKQQRPGKDEKVFKMYKFRTMTNERDHFGDLLPDHIRLTQFGKLLRSTSLDELPELINILKGDMSIVGPRPQLVKDLVFMTKEQRKRHLVTPGLTGWAQVNGRNGIAWEEKLSMDLEYIGNITLVGDIKIILMTIKKVIKREGISADGIDTSEDYGDYLLREMKISEAQYYAYIEKSKELIRG